MQNSMAVIILAEFNGGIHFFCFGLKTQFLGKFGQFKLKFGTYTNSNMQNSMAVIIFSVLEGNTLFRQI